MAESDTTTQEANDPGKPYRADAKRPPSNDPEVEWFRNVYQGDERQFTLRSFIVGTFLGALMALSNLYVGLKTGWGLGVAITACILSFALGSIASRIRQGVFGWVLGLVFFVVVGIPAAGTGAYLLGRFVGVGVGVGAGVVLLIGMFFLVLYGLPALFKGNLKVLENNAMQSTASSAASTTTVIVASAMSALLMVRGKHLPMLTLMGWLFFMAVLGTVMAIPMKRQMINIEKLRFPSGTAAAETLKSLYGEGAEALLKARALFVAMGIGAVIAWLRDAHAAAGHNILGFLTKLSVIPGQFQVPGAKLRGLRFGQFTLSFEGSLIMIAAGALIGLRTTVSMVVAAVINYGIVAPIALDHGVIHTHPGADGAPALGYRAIVSFSLWPGAALMVTSGLLSFGLQWRTMLRAFSGFTKMFTASKDKPKAGAALDDDDAVREELEKIEVPTSWFVVGTLLATLGLVIIGWVAFDIRPWLGVIAVILSFVLAIVACRATGETDITPIGAMGKITQLTYGILAPAKIVTNLMTASITAGSAAAAADLLNDLKSGYLLGANPRQQFLAQLSGTLIGTVVVVPAFYTLVPTPDVIGSDRFPAPSAQVWKGVAEVLANGVHSLHPWARWGMLVGGSIGIILPLLELWLPKYKKWIPSATGLGLALVIPFWNSFSMFLGALIAYVWTRTNKDHAERYVVPIASGLIAGESLLGVAVALLSAFGYLE